MFKYLLIWRVVALCASILALFCVIGLAILALFFPKPYAAVLKSVGLNQIALGVYEDIYKNSQDVNDGYVYLTESIYAKSNKDIINAFEMVIKDGNSLKTQNDPSDGKSRPVADIIAVVIPK